MLPQQPVRRRGSEKKCCEDKRQRRALFKEPPRLSSPPKAALPVTGHTHHRKQCSVVTGVCENIIGSCSLPRPHCFKRVLFSGSSLHCLFSSLPLLFTASSPHSLSPHCLFSSLHVNRQRVDKEGTLSSPPPLFCFCSFFLPHCFSFLLPHSRFFTNFHHKYCPKFNNVVDPLVVSRFHHFFYSMVILC